jgi:ribose transport system ATP-binding protein
MAQRSAGGTPLLPRVRVTGLSKTFPGTRALDDVSLQVRPGEIHALVGGNGSGKSTLIKVIAGVHQGDEGGTIEIGETSTPADSITPSISYDAGVRVVHQDLGVFPTMTVAENLALGSTFETGQGGWIRRRATMRRTRRLIERFEIPARPTTLLAEMGRTGQTLVAIARALQDQETQHGGLLILDEPTAALPAHEVEMLLGSLKRYAAAGQSILYVSHRLDEVLSHSDRVTVLRDGRMAGTHATAELDEDRLIELIVGRRLDRVFPDRSGVARRADTLLEVEGLAVGPVRNVSFDLNRGEVLGIGGLLGSGRSEILRVLFGDLRREAGTVRLDGSEVKFAHPAEAMRCGVAFVPENRADEAAFAALPVATNLSAAALRNYWNNVWLRDRRLRRDAGALMSEYMVKAASGGALLETLSGGNQQKVILARWLRRSPRLLLLDEPTQGVDVGARAEIYKFIRQATEAGAGAIVVASDFEELLHASDRVLVLRGGRAVAEVSSSELDADHLTRITQGMEGALANG